MANPAQDRIDRWLRREGLPTLVPRRRRWRGLLWRTTPLVLAMAGVLTFVWAVLAGRDILNVEQLARSGGLSAGETSQFKTVYFVLLGVAFVVLVIGPCLGAWWLQRRLVRWGLRARWLSLALSWTFLGLMTWGAFDAVDATVVVLAVVLVGAHLIVGSGVAAVLVWAARWSWRSLPALQTMASRALPVILSLVVFTFYSTEPWQVADAMTTGQRWAMIFVLMVVATIAIAPVARSEVDNTRQELDDEALTRLLGGTPLAGTQAHVDADHDLTRLERLNVIGVLVLAQLIQAGLFLLVISGLLSLLGRLTLRADIVKVWSGRAREDWVIPGLHVTLPIDHQTVRTALFLGAIAALTFVLTTLTDPSYRGEFFDPLVERLRVAVAAHAALGAMGDSEHDITDPDPMPPEPDVSGEPTAYTLDAGPDHTATPDEPPGPSEPTGPSVKPVGGPMVPPGSLGKRPGARPGIARLPER